MKKTILILSFFAIASLAANQDDNCCPPPSSSECECPPLPPCCDIPGGPTTSAYNHPANIDVCGSWDLWITGTFLWIQPRQEQMEFAETYYNTPPTNTPGIGTVHEFNFNWKPSFKVGLGHNMSYDNWDFYLQYLRINTTMNKKRSRGTNTGELLGNLFLIQYLNAGFTEVTCKWKLNLNIFDLEFGRPYYNGEKLKFRIHYGLRGGWIYQSVFTQGINIDVSTVMEGNMKSKSWLIGPRAGINTKWNFDDGFRFFGNAAAALFYQKFYRNTHREPYTANTTQWYVASERLSKQIIPSLDAFLGVGWGTYFSRNNWHFDLAIGYEAQLFFNQNQIIALKEILQNTTHTKAGNLMFHGLNATVQFDF
jgi:hypothetical protein